MSVVAYKPGYEFAARDRAEVFGDDMLVHVHWLGNLFFCAAAAFRAPKAMTFGDFKANMLQGLFGADPDYATLTPENTRWLLGDTPIQPRDDQSLADLGLTHKGLLKFEKVS
ncbi:MAG TPA: phenol hydroxylase subunit P4 [Chloroflexia bacterium]|nr:phenol hydroxylase subunit P4 [Chloroflexia bacterium]